jgi:hypothetical protein
MRQEAAHRIATVERRVLMQSRGRALREEVSRGARAGRHQKNEIAAALRQSGLQLQRNAHLPDTCGMQPDQMAIGTLVRRAPEALAQPRPILQAGARAHVEPSRRERPERG